MDKRVGSLEVRTAVLETRGKVSENRISDLEVAVSEHTKILLKMQGVTAFLVIVVPVLVEYLK
jgi:uncharacterized coiled-coil protein SlyX|tara:strand:+ start:726 stop:914 length:189 start_codon:yes stop_codon:yes gene_type:complete